MINPLAIVTAAFAVLAAIFGLLYKGEVDAHAKYVAAVKHQSETVRFENLAETSRLEAVVRDSDAAWAAALAVADSRPVRVLPARGCEGGLSATTASAGLTTGTIEEPRFSPTRDVAAEECEKRLNWAMEDAARIEHIVYLTDQQAKAQQ